MLAAGRRPHRPPRPVNHPEPERHDELERPAEDVDGPVESTLHDPASGLGSVSGPRPLTPPPEIPGYEVHEVVGRGSTGTVYRATQLAVDREVALKVLHAELTAKPRIVRRLQREARTLARLAHPNVVAAIDMGRAGDRWWFAMEFVEGKSLADRLRAEGRLAEREALRLFTPLADALGHLWEHGVVHRDIKPANILLEVGRGAYGSRGVRARLADLGLAFADDDPGLTGQGGVLGTPHYISPEQARDAGDVDIRSDIWAFGATLFHALTGRPPFRGDSMAEVLSGVLHARIPDPQELAPGLSGGMALVLRKCLVRDPNARYQTPVELLEDLDRLRERRAPRVRRAELDPLERHGFLSRHPWLSGAAAGITAALVGTLLAVQPWRDEPLTEHVVEAKPERFEPLEGLLASVRADRSQLGRAFDDLEAMRLALPESSGPRWWDARRELSVMLSNRVAELRREFARDVERSLAEQGFAGALEHIAGVDDALREAVGMRPEDLPELVREELAAELDALRERVGEALEPRTASARQALLARFDQVVEPEVRADVARGAWRTALARLEVDTDLALAEAGLDVSGWTDAARDEAVLELRVRAKRLAAELRDEWAVQRRALLEWLDTEQARIASELGFGSPRDAAGPALEASFERALEGTFAGRDELPLEGLDLVLERLAGGMDELDQRWLAALEAGMQQAYDLRREVLLPLLLSTRRYADAAQLYASFESELRARLAQAPASLAESGGTLHLLERLAVDRLEIERLVAMFALAATGVRLSDGERVELEVLPIGTDRRADPAGRRRGIRVPGVLVSGPRPDEDGFRLRPDTREPEFYLLRLETLDRADLERFFARGLEAAEDAPAAGSPWLERALLRYHERDRRDAQMELIGARSWPFEGRVADLVEDLRARLEAPWPEASGPEHGAAHLLDVLGPADDSRALERRDPSGAAAVLEILLDRFAQQPAVGLNRPGLQARLDAIRAAQDA